MRPSALSRVIRASRFSLRGPSRTMSSYPHTRRELPYNIDEGLGDFLPPDALKVVAKDYQEGLLERLNNLIRGTDYEGKSIANIVIISARVPKDIAIFNTASQALNNDFFLDNLRQPSPGAEDTYFKTNPEFVYNIARSFGSLDNMKSVMSATAMGMSSSGWVWLVEDANSEFAALPTFGAGTILVTDRAQNGGNIFYGVNNRPAPASPLSGSPLAGSPLGPPRTSPTSGATYSQSTIRTPLTRSIHGTIPAQVVNPYKPMTGGAYGSFSGAINPQTTDAGQQRRTDGRERVGEQLTPLFCISVHEHVWMSAGLGVWGKEEYLRRFWTALDWARVLRAWAPRRTKA